MGLGVRPSHEWIVGGIMSIAGRADSTWAPLRVGIFRALWLAVLVSNIGTWMQTVGAQWLLVQQPHASLLVALVQTAARVKVLSPPALLARLQHRFEVLTGRRQDASAHQQTLRATIAWSYNLLSSEEQTIFRRLCVFVGGAIYKRADGDIGSKRSTWATRPTAT